MDRIQNVRKQKVLLVSVIVLLLAFSSIGPALATDLSGKQVGVSLSHKSTYYTNADSIENVPLVINQAWFTNMFNCPDGGGPIFSPKVQLNTAINLVEFGPNDPQVFTANPPYYTWDFAGLQVNEGAIVPLNSQEEQSTITAKPRFSIYRSVEPEILTQDNTLQTVSLRFKLEEPLLPEINHVNIVIGSPVIAYEENKLVEGYFVSQNQVPGWTSTGSGSGASWTINPSEIKIGESYYFEAILNSVKSPELLGSPIFKPSVMVQYLQAEGLPSVTGKSATITMPDNSISATYSVENTVDWSLGFSNLYFDFLLGSETSQVSTEPPFHVLITANIKIEPQTLNLKSNGVITAFVTLPSQYSVQNIDVSTVKCQGAPANRGTVADDTLVVKFERQALQGLIAGQEVNLQISGQLNDGSIFSGQATVKVK